MFNKILVPSDGSTQAARAALIAADLARSEGAQVVGLSVIEPFPHTDSSDVLTDALKSYYIIDASAVAGLALYEIAKACDDAGVPFTGEAIERPVAHEGILETVEAQGCDLVVMGSHGQQGIKAQMLGSVAQKVLTRARVPVLIVKC